MFSFWGPTLQIFTNCGIEKFVKFKVALSVTVKMSSETQNILVVQKFIAYPFDAHISLSADTCPTFTFQLFLFSAEMFIGFV